jgi:hypothetical protein
MSVTFIVLLAILLPLSAIFRFVLLDRWIEYLNRGLPPDQHLQPLGWWTPSSRGVPGIVGANFVERKRPLDSQSGQLPAFSLRLRYGRPAASLIDNP